MDELGLVRGGRDQGGEGALGRDLFDEREFFIDNLLVRIHFIIVMIRWTGLNPHRKFRAWMNWVSFVEETNERYTPTRRTPPKYCLL